MAAIYAYASIVKRSRPLRNLLLRLIAGDSAVAINVGVIGAIVVPNDADAYFQDCIFDVEPSTLRDLATVNETGDKRALRWW